MIMPDIVNIKYLFWEIFVCHTLVLISDVSTNSYNYERTVIIACVYIHYDIM